MKNIEVMDVHVGGDVHRIVIGGVNPPPGETVLERMKFLRINADGLRKFLLDEPRGGHPSLFANLVVPPSDPAADAGFIIMENMGYPMFSGTNTISTAHAVLSAGLIPMPESKGVVKLEAPGGLVEVSVHCKDAEVREVTFVADMPSYVVDTGLHVDVHGFGRIGFDVVWAGVFYPMISTEQLGFALDKETEPEALEFSKRFVEAIRSQYHWVHPTLGDPGLPSFVILIAPSQGDPSTPGQVRRVSTYVHPSNGVCRSPAGTGTMAVATLLSHHGSIEIGEPLKVLSPFGTWLTGRITEATDSGLIIAVTGQSWTIARSTLPVQAADPLTPDEGLIGLLK